MSALDHFIKHQLGIKYYGRDADNFVMVHTKKDPLKSLILIIAKLFITELYLKVHPKIKLFATL